MTKKRNRDYWKRRFLYEKEQQLQNTAEYETAMLARLKEVEHVLEQEVDYWLKRYSANQKITVKDARKILSTIGTRDWHMTLKEFKAKAKAGGFDKELDAEYFRSQLSRLENIVQNGYSDTNHTDPWGYLTKLGITKAQFAKDLKKVFSGANIALMK